MNYRLRVNEIYRADRKSGNSPSEKLIPSAVANAMTRKLIISDIQIIPKRSTMLAN